MKSKIVISLAVIITLAVLIILYSESKEHNDMIIMKNEDTYTLDMSMMSGEDQHMLDLSRGDVLRVQFRTDSGRIKLEIDDPDGSSIYEGNGKEATLFNINIADSGEYKIKVRTSKARGIIHIDRL